MEKIKLGLIGVGKHVEENIIPALKLNESVIIEGVYSSKKSKGVYLQKKHNLKFYYDSWVEMIDSGHFDCFTICGSPEFHEEVLRYCIEKSSPFFVEKPPLESLKSFESLPEKLPINRVGYNFRQSPLVEQGLERLLNEEELEYLKINYVSSKPDEPIWNHDSTLKSFLYAVGIHPIELILYQLGNYSRILVHHTRINFVKFALDINVEFANGKKATLHMGNYLNRLEYTIRGINTSGSILDIYEMTTVKIQKPIGGFNFNKKECIVYSLSGSEGGYYRSGYQVEIDRFIESIKQNKPDYKTDILASKEVYRLIEEIIAQTS